MISEAEIAKAHILPLRYWPCPTLSENCQPLEESVEIVHEIAHAMIATMRAFEGVGLAGPQVGMLKQIFVVETTPGFPLVFANPRQVVVDDSKTYSRNEGCLSIPGVFAKTKRPNTVSFEFDHVDGFPQTYTATGFEAFAIQHEIDHLNGRLFIDDWSKLKKERAMKKVNKQLR